MEPEKRVVRKKRLIVIVVVPVATTLLLLAMGAGAVSFLVGSAIAFASVPVMRRFGIMGAQP